MKNQSLDKLMRQATEALNRGAYRELQGLCKQVLSIDRHQADAWFFMSLVAEAGRQPAQALQFVDRALQVDSSHSEYLAQKARLHSLLNQYRQARIAASQAMAANPERAIVLDTLGVVFTRLGRYLEARDLLYQAVTREPGNPQYQFNLGSAEQFLGNEAAARSAYEKAISLRPEFSRAYWALSELDKIRDEPEHLDQLLTLHDSPTVNSMDRLYLAHAIARDYEKLGDYDNAFEILKNSKLQRRKEINYSIESDFDLFKKLKELFTVGSPAPAEADVLDGRAVFIVGMPRSGTTLLERILNSHSLVDSLGELQEFPRAVKQISEIQSPVVLDADTLEAASHRNMEKLGSVYAALLDDRTRPDVRFIDKLPLNFYLVGFILAALPQARVICLRRNPLDTILSNYRQLFALNFSYYNYHYDLGDTARFYVEFDHLMDFWKAKFGDRFYQLHYESLVNNSEQSARGVVDFLGLVWEPDCLEFHKQGGAVATASASQVRQPLYNSAIARWKKYEKHLTPAMEVLDKAGIVY